MDDETPGAPERSKPSKVPSWLSLGFVLGALFILALPKHTPPSDPEIRSGQEEAKPVRPAPVPLSTIEAAFEEWGHYAAWADGTTQVALWSPETHSFSEFYEVRRVGDDLYYRTLTSLTRPLLTHGVPEGSPLQFTESVRQRQQWLSEVNTENWRQIDQGIKDSLAPSTPAKTLPAEQSR